MCKGADGVWTITVCVVSLFFFFKQKTAYEMLRSLVGSEMCIRDSARTAPARRHGGRPARGGAGCRLRPAGCGRVPASGHPPAGRLDLRRHDRRPGAGGRGRSDTRPDRHGPVRGPDAARQVARQVRCETLLSLAAGSPAHALGGPSMPGAMRKLGLYLGLVEDDESAASERADHDDEYDDDRSVRPLRIYSADTVGARPVGMRP